MNCGLRDEIWQPEALLFGCDSVTVLERSISCSTERGSLSLLLELFFFFCLVSRFYIYSWASAPEIHRCFESDTSGAQHKQPPKLQTTTRQDRMSLKENMKEYLQSKNKYES